jgi:glycosyltransferase involved in cell wall biosynthesis
MPRSINSPLISVIIPTYNRAGYIVEAVESVLAQSYSRLELIVVVDGSIDDTRQILMDLGGEFRYLWQENRGFAAARNAGVAVASGSFLAFIDSDDIWLPGKLQQQMAVYLKAPATDLVYGHAEQFASPELTSQERARLQHMAGKILPSPMVSSLLIRRTTFNQVGSFDESLSIGVDMDWYARMSENTFNVFMMNEVVYRRRLHRDNLNLTHANKQSERLHVLKRALDRRRNRQPAGN